MEHVDICPVKIYGRLRRVWVISEFGGDITVRTLKEYIEYAYYCKVKTIKYRGREVPYRNYLQKYCNGGLIIQTSGSLDRN